MVKPWTRLQRSARPGRTASGVHVVKISPMTAVERVALWTVYVLRAGASRWGGNGSGRGAMVRGWTRPPSTPLRSFHNSLRSRGQVCVGFAILKLACSVSQMYVAREGSLAVGLRVGSAQASRTTLAKPSIADAAATIDTIAACSSGLLAGGPPARS